MKSLEAKRLLKGSLEAKSSLNPLDTPQTPKFTPSGDKHKGVGGPFSPNIDENSSFYQNDDRNMKIDDIFELLETSDRDLNEF